MVQRFLKMMDVADTLILRQDAKEAKVQCCFLSFDCVAPSITNY